MPDPAELISVPVDLLAAPLHQGETGREISYPANDSLTGATVTLQLKAPNGQRLSLGLTVSSDGTRAYRLPLANDYPVPGIYKTTVKVVKADTSIVYSDEHDLEVVAAP